MKKSLTALFALMFAFIFGSATIAYAEAPAAGAAQTEKNEEMKTDKNTKKQKKTKKEESH
jgi:ribosomal protein L12E/L44/L45/RPP1/RPP2